MYFECVFCVQFTHALVVYVYESKEKRKQWKEEDMVSAMEAVSQGMAVSTAAKPFDVPRKRLDDRVKGRVKHGTKPGQILY